MSDATRARICPLMRRLIAMIGQMSLHPGLQERGQLIDRLTDLEAESLARNVPWRTVEAIRATRLKLRVESLMPRPSLPRGH